MQLSLHADYALRVLIYLGAHPGEVVSTQQISNVYGISKNHLVRVMQTLGEHGYIQVLPGRSGGVKLAMDPALIRLGDVVRNAEPNLRLVECFDRHTNTCPIVGACDLKGYLADALAAFITEMNRHTLAEILDSPTGRRLQPLFVRLSQSGAMAPAVRSNRSS